MRNQRRFRGIRSSVCPPPLAAGHALAIGVGLSALLMGRTAAADPAVPGSMVSELHEVVVKAQRRSQDIQSVPVTITALSAHDLKASGVESTMDLPIVTPGLNVNEAGQYFLPHLRGVGTSADAASVENPVALYVDGVYIGSQTGSVFNLVSIKQVEVDKGPQGTLFGRNATGGLIQVTTLDPKSTPGGAVSVGYGNYDTTTASFYVTGGVAEGLAADWTGYVQNQGQGYGTNLFNGQPINKTNNLVTRTKWLFTPSDVTRATLILDYSKENGSPALKPFPGTVPPGGYVPTSPQDAYVAASDYDHRREYGASLQIDHSLGFANFSSLSAYRRSTYVVAFPNASPDPADITIPLLNENYHQFSEELHLASKDGSRITWVAGTFLYSASAGWQPLTIYGPAVAPLAINISDEQKTYSAAAYGQATIPIAAATNLTVGGRFTFDRRNWNGVEAFTGIPIPSFGDSQHIISNQPTWRLSLDHHFNQRLMGFVSYNRGFKSGGFNDSVVPGASYRPETLDAYETGLKSMLFGRRLRLNGSAFYYDYRNIQVTRFFSGNENVYNGSGARIYGVDLDADAQITDRLKIRGGVEYLHDRYTDFPLADYTVPAPGGGSIFSTQNAEGNRLGYTPDWTATFAADYTFPIELNGTLAANVAYYYNGGWFANPDQRLKQAAYNIVNASLTWSSSADRLSVSLWGRNLGNANYAALASESQNGDFIVYAPPRTYGLTLSTHFGSMR